MKSIIYSVDKETLQKYINESKTWGQLLQKFGLKNRGSNHVTIKKRIADENLDVSQIKSFSFGAGWNKGIPNSTNSKLMSKDDVISNLFIKTEKNPSFRKIKKYLRLYNFFPHECFECKLVNMWNNKPITIELDHIDGNCNNNELLNLRWLCPNCHSQTNTFRGRNRRIKNFCKCGTQICKESKFCLKCFPLSRTHSVKVDLLKTKSTHPSWKRKVAWPSKEELQTLIQTTPTLQIAKKYGVSDNAIRKWCNNYGIVWRKNKMVGPDGNAPSSSI
jgi:hypothetical protein